MAMTKLQFILAAGLLALAIGGAAPRRPQRAAPEPLTPQALAWRHRPRLDSPNPEGGGSDSTRKKAERCVCPPVEPEYSVESIKAEFQTLRYDTLALNPSITGVDKAKQRAAQETDRRQRRLTKLRDKAYYQDMLKRLRQLDGLRLQACCLVIYLQREVGNPNMMDGNASKALKERAELQRVIGRNWGLLNTDLQIIEDERGEQAQKNVKHLETTFRSMDDSTALKYLDQPDVRQMVEQLKENIFFSRNPPNLNCQGGVGNWLRPLPREAIGNINPQDGCVGYNVSLGRGYNLIVARLTDKRVIAIVWDKTKEGYFGAVKLI
jgi:hypothetical protein